MEIKDTIALGKLAERLKNPIKQINNGNLPAGSPMYFYCVICGYQSDVLPESYTSRPKKYCTPCKDLKDVTPGITDASLKELALKD